MRAAGPRSARGFTLIEVMIALAVTLSIMGAVWLLTRSSSLLHRVESHRTERGFSGLRALDDMAVEIARAGFGLGSDVERLRPGLPGGPPSSGAVTLRSNPEGVVGTLRTDLVGRDSMVAVAGAARFQPGDDVLLVDANGGRERAQVVRAEREALAFRSLDRPDGRFRRPFRASQGARVLKVREVRFWLKKDGLGAVVLAKQVEGQPEQVLARHVGELRFDYVDDVGEPVAPARVRPGRALAGVRVTLRLVPDPAEPPIVVPPLSLFVALEAQAATVTFDEPRPGFRLRRIFYPMKNPVGVVSRPFAGAGVILGATLVGTEVLYSFPLHRLVLDARIDSLLPLSSVRGAAALGFAPEEGPWSGYLFVVTGALRAVQVWRVSPDSGGGIGPASALDLVAASREMTSLGGAAFGADGALYLSDRGTGTIFRYVPGEPDPRGAHLEPVAAVPGRPGHMALGENGSIYCLAEQDEPLEADRIVLWELPFDTSGAPEPPRRVARLAGEPRSLALDPITGSLFVLLLDRFGDSVLLELSRPWLRRPVTPPREAFRLSLWKKELEQTLGKPGDVVLPLNLFPPSLDFASFDAGGTLYLGAGKVSLVLQAELDRPQGAGFHRIGVAGIVGQDPASGRPRVHMHAWKKTAGF